MAKADRTADDEKNARRDMDLALHVYRNKINSLVKNKGLSEDEARETLARQHSFGGEKKAKPVTVEGAFGKAVVEHRKRQSMADQIED